MRIKRIFLYPLAIAFAVLLLPQAMVFSQTPSGEPQTVTLLARKKVNGVDNYTQAAFSFKYGGRDAVHIELHLSPDEWLKLNGEMLYKVERLGFGVRFLNVPTHDEQVLKAFIDKQDLGSLESLPFPRVRGYKQ